MLTTWFCWSPQELTAALVVLVALYALSHVCQRFSNLPPGPIGLPLIGYLPFLLKEPHIRLEKLRRKYGPVFSIYLGQQFVVVLGNFQAVNEAFSQDFFLDRPDHFSFNLRKDVKGMIQSSGNVWKEQRRFTLRVFKDFGYGKRQMEEQIKAEIRELIDCIRKEKGRPFDPSNIMMSSISNIISIVILGKRFNYDDPQRLMLDHLLDHTKMFNQISPHTFFPWLLKPLSRLEILGYKNLQSLFAQMVAMIKREIATHRATLEKGNPRDYIDSFLTEMDHCQAKKKSTSFTESMLKGNIRNLFGAGSETVCNAIRWALLLLAMHPQVQHRAQKEIDATIGREREPAMTDCPQLPYMQAVIMEIQRWTSVFYFNPLRRSSSETTIMGYRIPKGSIILANLWSVHHDQDIWTDPHAFLPQRFLDEDSLTIVKPDAYIPFSIGKRACPAENLANAEMFLYLTAILQNFNIAREDPTAPPDLSSECGITLACKPYKLCFSIRE